MDTTEIFAGPVPGEQDFAPGPEFAQAPAIIAAPPPPWYKRPVSLTIIATVVSLVSLGVALFLAVGVSHSSTASASYSAPSQSAPAAVGQPTPASILAADGYTKVMDLSPSQFSQFAGSDGASLKPYIASVSIGTRNGDSMEMVVALTSEGRDIISTNMDELNSSLGSGLTGHMQDGYLVVSGPLDSGSLGGAA